MMGCCVLQLLANIVIYFCAITVGVMSYYMADRKHRKAFLEAPAVAGGEAQHGGTKSAAGERNNQTKPNQHERVEYNAVQSVPSLEMQGLETRFLKAELLTWE